MRKLTVDEGRIFAEEDGSGEPVLLLHAGVTDSRVWDLTVPALVKAGYRTIRYDVRGFGRSAVPTEPHSLVADALAVLRAAGVESAHFVGLSQGAATSIDTALAHPDRVRSLTLVAPGLTGYQWPRLPGFARRMAAAEADDAHLLAVETARLWAPMSFPDAPEAPDSPGAPDASKGSDTPTGSRARWDFAAQIIVDQAETFMRDEMEIEEPDAVDRLDGIRAPTLVVLGDRDVDPVTDIGARLVRDIAGAHGVTLSGADHLLPLRVPERLAEVLLAHLETATTAAPATPART
jgi:3-oxoadipate enol-lactonase